MSLERFERSYCKCKECVDTCKREPGFLASGDLARISERFELDRDERDFRRFLLDNFEARPPLEHNDEAGEPMLIPVIAPKFIEDSGCTFLDSANQCAIHEVAPFMCRNCNACQSEGDGERRKGALDSLMGDAQYMKHWLALNAHQDREQNT